MKTEKIRTALVCVEEQFSSARNLHKPSISLRIQSIKEAAARKIAKKYEITLERLTKEYARIAFLDFSIFFDDDGRLLSIQEMSADAKASLAGLETVMVGTGDQVDYIKKIKTYDKLKALGDLATNTLVFSKRIINREKRCP
jgi:hypothetical protein